MKTKCKKFELAIEYHKNDLFEDDEGSIFIVAEYNKYSRYFLCLCSNRKKDIGRLFHIIKEPKRWYGRITIEAEED